MDIFIIIWSILKKNPLVKFLYLLILPNSARKMHLKAHIFPFFLGEHAPRPPLPGQCTSDKILAAWCSHRD